MNKVFSFILSGLLVIGLSLAVPARGESPKEVSYDPDLVISYGDWDAILRETVWDTGPSTRKAAGRVAPAIGTRLSAANQNPTRLEANKVFFHLLTAAGKDVVTKLRKSLEALPDEVPLENFSPDEQLAFWLNLRNVTVFEAVAREYMITNLRVFIDNLTKDKRLMVAGRAMSISDIENMVMARWSNPLVVYGFYLGNIGSPNLRTESFTGEAIWEQLEDNAKEFISSLRGMRFDQGQVRVSVFYERVAALFPDFESDLKSHLIEYAPRNLKTRLYPASRFKPTIKDWHIADLYNGKLHSPGSSNATNPAAFIMANNNDMGGLAMKRLVAGFPEHVQLLVTEIIERNYERDLNREAIVSIEEVDSEKD